MKHIKKQLLLISFIVLSTSCQVSPEGSTPIILPSDAPIVAVTPALTPTFPTPPTGAYKVQVEELTIGSACSNYSWKNRGRAPAGYIKGMALSFARSLCRLKANEKTVSPLIAIMSGADSSNASKDALTYYQNNFVNLPIQIDFTGDEPLRAVYVLGIGLGMRESSGVYCEGWDKSAGINRPSSGGEAGLFQSSYDSMGASAELSKLYSEYKTTSNSRCFLEVFKEGVSCNSSSILGTGPGADYQAYNKACPAFATEYAMVMLRILRGHYGPINRREAEVIPACNQLLKNVQDLIDSDTDSACLDFL
jgi:hypothetical protein